MNSANSSENIDHNRQYFLGPATMTGIFSSANAESTQPETTKEEDL